MNAERQYEEGLGDVVGISSMRPRPDERGKEVRVNHLTVLVYR